MKLVDPVLLRPLRAEWEGCKQTIIGLLDGTIKPPMRQTPRRRMSAIEAAEEVRSAFGERLRTLRILDPACGSGNFLYLALQGVKDIEYRANLECEMLGLHPRLPLVGPEIVRGIEINAMAAELARTTIWIGDIQWRLRNGIHSKSIPILRKLDAIETANALVATKREGGRTEKAMAAVASLEFHAPVLSISSEEAIWPEAEFILGNPPFLGAKLLRQKLGDAVVEELFRIFDGRVSREADLVCYWFDKALCALKAGRAKRVGLVSTNSIRGGANRRVLDRIGAHSRIFEAWSDQPWVVDGAAVRVSLVCFGSGDDGLRLDERDVSIINTDLTAGAVDLTRAQRLRENLGVAFMGDTKGGAFDIPGDLARAWLRLPCNPNGRPNSDVLRPWRNGMDVTRRSRDMWIIDFGWEMSEREASLYEAPFQYITEHVLPERRKNRRDAYKERWWRHVEPRPAMARALSGLPYYIITPRVAKYRIFACVDQGILADSAAIVIARDDSVTLGILQCRFHDAWSRKLGTSLEDRPRYTPTTTFETFPFPDGLTPDIPPIRYARDPRAIAIADAARRLDAMRNAWLNPADLVVIEPEVVPGYPDRILPRDSVAAAALRERTLTNLYNQNPQWLKNAHADLDAAVAQAYGWPVDLSEEDTLARLLDLNLTRLAADALDSKAQSKTMGRGRARTAKGRSTQRELLLPIPGGKALPAGDTTVEDQREFMGEKQSADQAVKRRPA
ncbi:class I SAM-dependent DNA methyltransferase [Rhizobium panacihumi]|uniref:class I SAM-dependent DNA methyltransferase n=1 Tax=Rhizobium panacihumi TaxID=2008450 RepID=UPI003D7A52EA